MAAARGRAGRLIRLAVDGGEHPLITALLARCTFAAPGTAVTCAVSGGADSTALLVLAIAAGCRVTAIHVDHGLRVGSAEEVGIVAATAARLGAVFAARRVDLLDGPNLEARARAARYATLPPDVLTGHTADDQAETMLLNLLRGAAGAGLGGMRPSQRRPLLALRRSETVELCSSLDIAVVDDPSNADPRHLRNRVRHELLPMLADLAGRDVVPVLNRQSDLLRDDDDMLVELATALDPADARELAGAPLPLARRAVRAWLRGEHPPDAAAVERVLDVARGAATACETAGGVRIERSRQRLRRVTAHGATADADRTTIFDSASEPG
ncbi:MAG: tRNA lysidine(34) synthetase TilS [Ilumatobacteraceae bacterium]